jgi:hypothetical protein
VDDYFVKPADYDVLISTLEKRLGQKTPKEKQICNLFNDLARIDYLPLVRVLCRGAVSPLAGSSACPAWIKDANLERFRHTTCPTSYLKKPIAQFVVGRGELLGWPRTYGNGIRNWSVLCSEADRSEGCHVFEPHDIVISRTKNTFRAGRLNSETVVRDMRPRVQN